MNNQTPAPPAASRRRGLSCGRCGCIALVGLVVLVFAGTAALRYAIRSKFDDASWAAMQAAHTKVIDLGPAWQRPVSIPPDSVVEFHADLNVRRQRLFDRYEELVFGDFSRSADLLANMQRGNPPPAEHATSYSLFLKEMTDVVDLTSAAVSQKDYTMDLGFQNAGAGVHLTLQTIAKYTGIVALEHARWGDCKAAIDIALLPVRTVRRDENAGSLPHLVATAVSAISSTNITAVADQCTDTQALRHGLDQMRQLRQVAFPGNLENWRYGDAIGPLQRAAAYGYPVDLSPRPLTDFYIDTAYMGARFDDWIIANRPADDHAVSAARERIAYRAEYAEFYQQMEDRQKEGRRERKVMPRWQRKIAQMLLGADPVALQYRDQIQATDEQMVRVRVGLAMYDLASLHLARRLQQLGAPVAPEDMGVQAQSASLSDAAVTSPLQLTDPFSGEPFPVHERAKIPYSVGPDTVDQQMSITYDPSNGTISPGDVWMQYR